MQLFPRSIRYGVEMLGTSQPGMEGSVISMVSFKKLHRANTCIFVFTCTPSFLLNTALQIVNVATNGSSCRQYWEDTADASAFGECSRVEMVGPEECLRV